MKTQMTRLFLGLLVTILISVLVSTGCEKEGPPGPRGPQGPAGYSCTVTQSQNGATVTCQDGTSAIVVNGANGINGLNGDNALLTEVPNDPHCTNGGFLLLGGTDLNEDGTLQMTEVTLSADVCNGSNGSNATQPEFTPVIVISPCGPNSSSYKEALLGLVGGGVFAEFTGSSSTTSVRNTMIPDGSYYDTDNSECYFSVSTDSHGNRTVSWNGSTANGSGPWGAGEAYYTESAQTWTENYTSPGN